MKQASTFLKALLLLIFPLFLACEHSGGQGQETNNKEHNNSTEKQQPNSQLPEAFKDFKVLELPIVLERPTFDNVGDLVKKLGVDIIRQGSEPTKRNIFITPDATIVELQCTSSIYAGETLHIALTVLDKNAKKIGDITEILYMESYAGMNYHSKLTESKISIEKNVVNVETYEESTMPKPGTNLEDPELIEEKSNTKVQYQITPTGIKKQ